MAQQGTSLQNYNNELIRCIDDLRDKREEVNRQILKEEEEKAQIQKSLSMLTDRLSKINEGLARKVQARSEYDKTIQETEGAYMKVSASVHAVRVLVLAVLEACRRTCLELGCVQFHCHRPMHVGDDVMHTPPGVVLLRRVACYVLDRS
jgi:Sjoegren syndrome nuclear autoantigen 1